MVPLLPEEPRAEEPEGVVAELVVAHEPLGDHPKPVVQRVEVGDRDTHEEAGDATPSPPPESRPGRGGPGQVPGQEDAGAGAVRAGVALHPGLLQQQRVVRRVHEVRREEEVRHRLHPELLARLDRAPSCWCRGQWRARDARPGAVRDAFAKE